MRHDNQPVVIFIASSNAADKFAARLEAATGFKYFKSRGVSVWNRPKNYFIVTLEDGGSIGVTNVYNTYGYRVYKATEEEILACCIILDDAALAEYLKGF